MDKVLSHNPISNVEIPINLVKNSSNDLLMGSIHLSCMHPRMI